MAVQARVDPAETYEADFAEWSATQADALKRRAVDELDWENLAEEIGNLARQDKHAIHSHLRNLLTHLIKWAIQPERRGSCWQTTIINARREIAYIVEESPSLQRCPEQVLERCRKDAVQDAARETEVSESSSRAESARHWTIDEILDHTFFPE